MYFYTTCTHVSTGLTRQHEKHKIKAADIMQPGISRAARGKGHKALKQIASLPQQSREPRVTWAQHPAREKPGEQGFWGCWNYHPAAFAFSVPLPVPLSKPVFCSDAWRSCAQRQLVSIPERVPASFESSTQFEDLQLCTGHVCTQRLCASQAFRLHPRSTPGESLNSIGCRFQSFTQKRYQFRLYQCLGIASRLVFHFGVQILCSTLFVPDRMAGKPQSACLLFPITDMLHGEQAPGH